MGRGGSLNEIADDNCSLLKGGTDVYLGSIASG